MDRFFKLFWVILLVVMMAGLSGCGAPNLRIDAPAAEQSSSNLGMVYIREVVDNRQFMDRPPTADIPSISPGVPVNDTTVRSRSVGRMRDGYGKARANVFLDGNRTVQDLTRQTLANALISSGYRVVETPMPGAFILDVSIRKFWGWMDVPPGLAWGGGTIYMRSSLMTFITVSGGGKPEREFIILAESTNRPGIGATPLNWQKLYRLLMEDYFRKIQSERL